MKLCINVLRIVRRPLWVEHQHFDVFFVTSAVRWVCLLVEVGSSVRTGLTARGLAERRKLASRHHCDRLLGKHLHRRRQTNCVAGPAVLLADPHFGVLCSHWLDETVRQSVLIVSTRPATCHVIRTDYRQSETRLHAVSLKVVSVVSLESAVIMFVKFEHERQSSCLKRYSQVADWSSHRRFEHQLWCCATGLWFVGLL